MICQLGGSSFACPSPCFAPNHVDGGATRDEVQPRRERLLRRESERVPREIGEHGLRDFLGEMWRAHLPARGRINEGEVTMHELRERGLRAIAAISVEQIVVARGHFILLIAVAREIRQKIRTRPAGSCAMGRKKHGARVDSLGKTLVVAGLVLAAIGAALWMFGRAGGGFLPGDIVVERKSFRFYFPVVTCLVVSLVRSAIAWLLRR